VISRIVRMEITITATKRNAGRVAKHVCWTVRLVILARYLT
jgi:hypothetical protein